MEGVINTSKLFLIFAFLIFFSSCSSPRSPVTAPESAGQQNNESYLWDFGAIEEGAVVRHNFILRNQSDKPLSITNISSSCGCTVAKVKKNKLSSGEETFIKVEFNSKGYSGNVEQFIYAHTDDLDNPVTRFIIKANVSLPAKIRGGLIEGGS